MNQIYAIAFSLGCFLAPLWSSAQPDSCNIPLVGKGRVIDQLSGGTACLLCSSPDLDHITDGDLSNFASFTTTVVLLATPIVSVKDVNNDFAAGRRAGFVVLPQGGLLDVGLLSGFQIKTYLNNTLQETATSGSGLSLQALGASGGKQRISFVTSLPFDEVELLQVTTLGALTSLRVYYAYTETANGCDYDCATEIVTGSPYNPTINNGLTGIDGICLIGCSVTNTANVINNNINDFGNITMGVGLNVQGAIGINIGATIPAGYDAGFAIAQNGGGLIDLSILNSTFIETYDNGNLRETIPFASLTDVTLLGGDIQVLSFRATIPFNRIRIRINSLVSLLVNVNVYYAFVRPDDDTDGFPNCVDKCANQNDNLDLDGDGKPDGCDPVCMVNAGLDISTCTSGTTAQLLAAGSGETWSTVAGNPAPATINNAGLVSNMTAEGTYLFQLSGSNGCRDTIAVTRQESALDDACNNPIAGFGVTSFDPSNGSCLLCLNASLILDGNLSTFIELDANLPIGVGTPIVGVWDTLHDYPAGRRVGFVVEAVGGLINLSLLSNFEIRTYLNGVLQETATTGNALLTAGVLPGNGNRQRISFVTTQPFDAVVLLSNALLSTIDFFRVYYAFEEPTTCPDLSTENCTDLWLAGNDYCADIVEDHTGLTGIACVGCSITRIGNLIDNDATNFSTITLTVGVGAEASIGVKSIQRLDDDYDAGFLISGGVNLLDAGVLGGLQLRTYLNNSPVDNYFATNALVDISLLGNGSDVGIVSFKPTAPFDEIRLTIYGVVAGLQTTQVYGAFARRDADQDNTPDCIDKCCSGSDDLDLDGDGAPNACDTSNDPPLANHDAATTPEDAPVSIAVLNNDGDPNFDVITLTGVLDAPHGTVSISGNNIIYTPDPNYNGPDTFRYIVCDIFSACDTGLVAVTVSAVNDAPVAQDDTATTPEDNPVTVNVTGNDTDIDGLINHASLDLDPGAGGIQTSFTIPGEGTFTRDGSGNVTFTPVPNFNGVSTLTYQVCDNGTPLPALCDQATVTITISAVNDAPVAANDQGSAAQNSPVTVDVLANDTDVDGSLSPGSVQIVNTPDHGMATVNPANGAVTFTPDTGFSGFDTLSYVVCDNGTPAACDTAFVFFTINGPVSECNDPISGKTAVVDRTGTGILCLLCGNTDIEHLVDGDLSNYAEFDAPVSVLNATPVVSIKDIVTDYAAGIRAGYVIEPLGGLINSNLLSSFQIRTYLNNSLQQTINGNNLEVQSIGTLRRLSFIANQDFDEVELLLVSTLGVLTSVRVYYAFVEPAAGCDYECISAVVPPDFNSAIVPARTGLGGLLCLLCSVNNTDNVVNNNTADFATINLLVGVGVNGSISVDAGEQIQSGYDAGFAISDGNGLLGLLDANVLGNTELLTYRNDSLQETISLNSALANVVLLGGSDAINLVSFKTTRNFDEIRIRVNSLVGLAINLRVHYAFVRPDDDSDGYANCVDKCAGFADYLDADGDGNPDGCDPVCMLNAGLDLNICPPEMTGQLPAAGTGQSWSALGSNPAGASINAAGMVTGMTAEGVYGFVLTEGTCSDTVYLIRYTATLDAACNNPLVANNIIIDQVGLTGGICLLCGGGNGQAIIDGNLSNYASYTVGVGVLTATSIISVKDTAQVYPAGRRTGFVVEPVGGLLDAVALNSLQIRTYLNNSLQEIAIVGGGLVAANIIGNGNLQRLSFVAGQPFDEIELVATSVLGAISTLRVYYGFEEPTSCPEATGDNCADALLATDNTYCGQISYDHTGITGICDACSINNLGNVVDDDPSNFAVINLSVGVGATGRISVYARQEIPAGYSAGFVLAAPVNLLDAAVLGGLRLRTYLNGTLQETEVATNGLIRLAVINAATGLTQVSFVTTLPFDEVQIQIDGVVVALSTINVYYGFARGDADADGAPDCADKCCGSNDNLDSNGNGVPDGCDGLPVAVNDAVSVPEDGQIAIPVVANDDFGPDGPGQMPISITNTPNHGTAMVNNNGTFNDPTDDFIEYTPALNFTGSDTLYYQICDTDNDCDTAEVVITVTPVNDPPIVPDITTSTPEDTPVNICVTIADADNSSFTVTSFCAPDGGVVSGLTNPATTEYCLTYTPNLNFNGPDTLCILICDGAGGCDTSYVFITVTPANDPPVVPNTSVTTPEDTPITVCVPITDADNSSFTVTSFCAPDGGVVSGLTNPATTEYCLTYTPNLNFNGPDTLCILVCDGPGACDTSYVFITVNAVNDPPIALNNNISTPEGTPVTIQVLNNDSDVENALDTTSLSILVAPDNGTASPNLLTGTIDYTPALLFIGSDTLTYVICDQGAPVLCDTATVIITVTATNVRLTLKMRLQGALYSSPDTLMRDDLRINHRIPKNEPYTALGPSFIHLNGGGGEMVTDSVIVFAGYGINSIVDWVFIELRDSANPVTVVATRSALLQRDGDVVDVDGVSPLVFSSSSPDFYYVAIRHRNHLGSMTSTPIALSVTGTQIDFTSLSTQLYDDGTNLNGLEQITINGKYALWAGNVNTNRTVVFAGQNNDKDPIFNQVDQAPGNIFRSQTYVYNGYHLGDVNLNARAIYAGQNNDVDPIFNNVDGHPRNLFKSQTFIIREQLAHQ